MPDVQDFISKVRAHLGETTMPAVYAVDCRPVNMFSPDVAEALIGLMKADNPKIRRTAILIQPNALFSLQIERMLREADNPARRTFADSEHLFAWLGEVISEAECDSVRSSWLNSERRTG